MFCCKETTCKETNTMIHLSIRKFISAKVVRYKSLPPSDGGSQAEICRFIP